MHITAAIARTASHRANVAALTAAAALVLCSQPVAAGTANIGAEPTSARPACSRYVAANGDDAATGTAASPWATVQHAARSVTPGDVVCVGAGEYGRDGEINLFTSGTPEAPIHIVAVDPEVSVVNAINIRPGVSSLRLSGFRIATSGQWGLALWGENSDITVSDLEVRGPEVGIRLTTGEPDSNGVFGTVSDVTVERSSILHTSSHGVACVPGPCTGVVLHDLEVAASGATGIELHGDELTVEDSRIHDNDGDGLVLSTGTTSARVERCQLERNRGVGVRLTGGGEVVNTLIVDSGRGALEVSGGSATVVNSTFVACLECSSLVSFLGPPGSAVHASSSIFFNDSPTWSGPLVSAATDVHLELTNNLLFNPFGESVVICRGDSCTASGDLLSLAPSARENQWVEPEFFAADLGDFHLGVTSPAVDSGRADLAPPVDIEQLPRDHAADIGAYEHRSRGCLLACAARVPDRAAVAEPVPLEATVRSSGCSEEPTVLWQLGDSTEASTRTVHHTYRETGTFDWTLEVASGNRVCRSAGTLAVEAPRLGHGHQLERSRQQAQSTGSPRSASISWWTVDGGGGTSSGGAYTLSGTIGQADASTPMSGGAYTLTGGFWAGVGDRRCDVDRSGTCDAADIAWILACTDDPGGCGCPGNPDMNGDLTVDGDDVDHLVLSVY